MSAGVIRTFVMLLAGGTLAALAMCRLERMACRYLRLMAALVLAMASGVLAWVWRVPASGGGSPASAWPIGLTVGLGVLAVALLIGAPLVERFPKTLRAVCALGGACGIGAGCAWTIVADPSGAGMTLARLLTIILCDVLAALLLGTVTAAWLLGHAYLTATSMTIEPLRRLSRLFLAAVTARAVLACVLLAVWWTGGTGTAPALMIDSWLLMSLRAGVGIVGVGAFALMVLGCVKWRNTQSATGILYFASIFAYVGELSSQVLAGTLGWPV